MCCVVWVDQPTVGWRNDPPHKNIYTTHEQKCVPQIGLGGRRELLVQVERGEEGAQPVGLFEWKKGCRHACG